MQKFFLSFSLSLSHSTYPSLLLSISLCLPLSLSLSLSLYKSGDILIPGGILIVFFLCVCVFVGPDQQSPLWLTTDQQPFYGGPRGYTHPPAITHHTTV